MTVLVTAIHVEGRTDERFLPVIIKRTAIDILARQGKDVIEVLDPVIFESDPDGSRAERILSVARKVSGYHILFVHADADHPTAEKAYHERIEPGIVRIQNAIKAGEDVCETLTPVIPIQMLEAWLLADPDALRDVIGTSIEPDKLNIPLTPPAIEGLADPKQQLTEIIRTAYAKRPQRRRKFKLGEFYQPLAYQIRLEKLAQLPAYQQFVKDFTQVLTVFNFIPR